MLLITLVTVVLAASIGPVIADLMLFQTVEAVLLMLYHTVVIVVAMPLMVVVTSVLAAVMGVVIAAFIAFHTVVAVFLIV